MPLESTMICLDNSEWMRNGDYIPTRMEAQHDAANLLCATKTQSNPESTVGVLTMAGSGPELLVSPTDDMGKILSSLHGVPIHGKTNFAAGVQIAQLALKHRRNKHGGQRIIIFVSSPIEDESKTLSKVGKLLKKNNVAADVISMGETEANHDKLQEFINAAKSGDNSHLVTIPPGTLPSDVLISSPIVSSDGHSGGGGAEGSGVGGDFGGVADFPGMDPSADPELAMALRVSMEEERARQEAAAKASAESEALAAAPGAGAGDGSSSATTAGAGAGAAAGTSGTEESKGSEDAVGSSRAAAEPDAMQVDDAPERGEGGGAGDMTSAAEEDDHDEEDLLNQALAISMTDGVEFESMRLDLDIGMGDDSAAKASEPAPLAASQPSSGAAKQQAPTPSPPPVVTSENRANPPPAPAAEARAGTTAGAPTAASAAPAGDSGTDFCDPSFVQSLLGQIPHLDPNDPRIQAAVEQVGESKKGEEKEGGEGNKEK